MALMDRFMGSIRYLREKIKAQNNAYAYIEMKKGNFNSLSLLSSLFQSHIFVHY